MPLKPKTSDIHYLQKGTDFSQHNTDTLPVPRRPKQIHPNNLGHLPLQTQGAINLVILKCNERIVLMSASVTLYEYALCSLARPLLTSHRGDLGMNQMSANWTMEERPCGADGMRQNQFDRMRKVPNVDQAATMLLDNQMQL
jgi:hypothetical protein